MPEEAICGYAESQNQAASTFSILEFLLLFWKTSLLIHPFLLSANVPLLKPAPKPDPSLSRATQAPVWLDCGDGVSLAAPGLEFKWFMKLFRWED